MSIVIASLFAIAVGSAPPPPPPPPPPAGTGSPAPEQPATASPSQPDPTPTPAPGPMKFSRIRMDVLGHAADRIIDDVASAFLSAKVDRAATPIGEGGVYVGVTRMDSGDTRILVVTHDLRRFSRTVRPTAAEPERELAAEVVTLLQGIERGEQEPDPPYSRVVVPPPTPEERRAQVVAERKKDKRWRVGFGLAPELAVGVYPWGFGRFISGGGGSLEGRARAPGGAVIIAGARIMANKSENISVLRARVAVLGGYGWRPGHAEIELAGGASFEPWWLRYRGTGVDPMLDGETGNPPLVGALLRLAVGGVVPAGIADLRIGGRLEVAGSAAPDRGIRVPGIVELLPAATREAFQLGGVEIIVGLDFAAMFPVGKKPTEAKTSSR